MTTRRPYRRLASMSVLFALVLAAIGLVTVPSAAQVPALLYSGTQSLNLEHGTVYVTENWRIDPSGAIDVSFSDLRAESSTAPRAARLAASDRGWVPTPLPYRFTFLRAGPVLKDLRIDQQKDPKGNIVATYGSFAVRCQVTGVAKRQQRTTIGRMAASVWEWGANLFSSTGPPDNFAIEVPQYGPIYPLDSVTYSAVYVGDFTFSSKTHPWLNRIPKDRFRPGTLTMAQFTTSLPATGAGEFPNRTCLMAHSGSVFVKFPGQGLMKAKDNMDLEIGDAVITQNDGKAEVLLAGTALLRIKPETYFRIPEHSSNTKERVSFIQMLKGVLWAKAKKEDDSLKVGTPNAVCGVRGTEITVEVKKADRAEQLESWCHCYEGKVLMSPMARAPVSHSGQPDPAFAPQLLTPDKNPIAVVGPQGFLNLPSVKHKLTVVLTNPISGKPAVGARVSVSPIINYVTGVPLNTESSGLDGRAIFRVPVGDYAVTVSYTADGHSMEGKCVFKVAAEQKNEVAPLLKNTTVGPVAAAIQPLRVAIIVEDNLHHPIPTARLLVRPQGESVAQAVHQATDRTGRATLELPPGKYDIVASADRFKTKAVVSDLKAGSHRETEIIILLQPTSDLPPPSPAKPLRVGIIVEDDVDHPIPAVRLLLRRQGDPATQAVHQLTDGRGQATLELPPGKYDVVATIERYKTNAAVLDVAAGRNNQIKLVLRRQDGLPASAAFSFAGEWDVYYYNGPSTAGQPTNREQWRIDLSRSSTATAYQKVGNQGMPYCQGPLSENGQVWNVRREVNGTVVFQLENLRLGSGGNRFAGKWNGAVPHGFAFLGIRAGTGPEIPVADRPKPPSVPAHPLPPVAPKRVTVELSDKNRHASVTAAPGDDLTVKVATYAGTGYRVEMVPPSGVLCGLVAGPRPEPMRQSKPSKPLVGQGAWNVYDFKVATGAKNNFRIVFRFVRPGQQRAEIEYTIDVQVDSPRGKSG